MHNSSPTPDSHSAGDLGASADEITCRQFVELVTDYFEGALLDRTLGQVEEHLVICELCATYAGQLQSTIEWLRELRDPTSPEPTEAVLEALRARKEGDR